MPLTAAQYAANLKSAQNIARQRAGLPPDSQLPDNALTYDQRNKYNKILADIIAKTPQAFSAQSVSTAQNVQAKTYTAMEDPYSVTDAARVAAESAGETVVKWNAAFNPFAPENAEKAAKTVKWTLILLAVGAAAIYLGPALFSGGQRLKRTTAGRRTSP